MKAQSISDIKQKLKTCGFYDGPLDETVTPGFTAAVAEAQRAVGAFADGMWGRQTEFLIDKHMREKRLG